MASNMAESCPTTGCGGLGRGRLRIRGDNRPGRRRLRSNAREVGLEGRDGQHEAGERGKASHDTYR